MKKYPSIEEADALIEKYYDGSTSTDEEKQLRLFLNQRNLPNRFDTERALFGYFKSEQKPKRGLVLTFSPFSKWIIAAAVIFSAIFIVEKQLTSSHQNVAYVNGVRLTDTKQIESLALASIRNLDLENDGVKESMNRLNEGDLIQSQLENFPTF